MAEGEGIIKKVAEAVFKAVEKDAGKGAAGEAAKKAEQEAAKKAEQEALKEAERKAIGEQLRNAHNPLDIIPEAAQRPPFHPVEGGSQYGANYKWATENGQTVRVRVHGPDASAPTGSNAGSGVTYRVQVGQRYLDKDGNVYHRQVHNSDSPYYDPAAANATHIPWPSDVPYPTWG